MTKIVTKKTAQKPATKDIASTGIVFPGANLDVKKATKTTKAKKKKKTVKKTTKKKSPASTSKTPAKSAKINCQLPGAELLRKGKSVKEIMDHLEGSEKIELKAEHERFCGEYIIDDNATRSYMRVYPECGYNSARALSSKLLTNVSIMARVEELREKRNKRLEISADKVLRRLEARASVTPRDLYQADGTFIPIHELHPDIAIGIKSVEVAELYAGTGDQRTAIGLVRKITMNDGKASDELLGKNLKLWKEAGTDDNPVVVVNRIELVAL